LRTLVENSSKEINDVQKAVENNSKQVSDVQKAVKENRKEIGNFQKAVNENHNQTGIKIDRIKGTLHYVFDDMSNLGQEVDDSQFMIIQTAHTR